MKKSKQILAAFLCAAMVLAFVPAFSVSAEEYSGTCGDNLTWVFDTDTGVLTISGTGEMKFTAYYFYMAPWNSFRSSIKSVVIEDGVTSIYAEAFYSHTSLTNITIPDSVESIGRDAFYNTAYYNNTSNWENGVLYIGKYLLKAKTTISGSYTITSGTVAIAGEAFENCTSLTSIKIPDSVTNIGSNAFSGCTSLEKAYYTGKLAAWCDITFVDGYANPMCHADNLYINGTLATKITVPSGVTEIKDYAFYDCTGIKSVTIPDSVISIGKYSFSGCTALTSLTIGAGVTTIDNFAFYGCGNLNITVDSDNMYYSDNDGVLLNKNQTELITYTQVEICSDYVIPDSVETICDYAFYYCTELTSITIPDSVTIIGNYAFYGCTGLTSVTIGANVTSIGNYAFYGCTELTSITIPNSVTSIGSHAFSYCSGLTSVTIPDSVTSIGNYAFCYCTGLTSVTIPDSVTSIDTSAFSNCTGLTSVTIPDSVTTISMGAFYNCSSLTDVYYGGNWAEWSAVVIYIENTALTSATIHYTEDEGETKVYSGTCGENLTWELNSETGVLNISGTGTMTDYGYSNPPWYYGREMITSVSIDDGVTSIGSYAFCDCTLTDITIGHRVTVIGSNAVTPEVTIYGYSGSTAEIYAEENGNEFISLGGITIDEVYVSSYEELLNAITSYRVIKLADGVYLTDSALSISGVKDLTITAENSGKAEILSTDGYNPVVNIYNADNISLSGLILGHESLSYHAALCGGPDSCGYVIYASYSENIKVSECDFYGCGTIGVYLNYYVTGFSADSCVIRDCSEQIASIEWSSDAVFTNCIISGNAYDEEYAKNTNAVSIMYADDTESSILFDGCTFLNNYSVTFTSNEQVTLENCTFENNAWDGKTPLNYGVCLNGITWQIEEHTLKLGYDLTLEDGTVITSSAGDVLPYSESSLPWKGFSYSTVDLSDGVTYVGNGSDGNTAKVITSGSFGNNLEWYIEDGTLVIFGSGSMSEEEEPWYAYRNSITKVIIEDGVTNMADSAFYKCSSLESVMIPKSLTSIDIYAFWYCSSLTDVYYAGSEEEWAAVDNYSSQVRAATIHYNCAAIPTEALLTGLGEYTEDIEADAVIDENGYASITLTIANDSALSSGNVTAYAVTYSGGAVDNVEVLEKALTTDGATFTGSVSGAYKIFIWDENMQPITEKIE